MRIIFHYNEYKGMPEEATLISYRRNKTATILSLFCSPLFILGIVFSAALDGWEAKVSGIALILVSISLFIYLCTGYRKQTQKEIEEIIAPQIAHRIKEAQTVEQYKKGNIKIDNPALQARMDLWANSYNQKKTINIGSLSQGGSHENHKSPYT